MTLHLVVIVGPTASGKTRLGVEVAHRLESEIISADSRQVYRGLDLGTGKDLQEYAAVTPPVPVHLLDVAPPEQVYTLFDYQRDCFRLLEAMAREGRPGSAERPVVMVGGSGLYIEAVLRQYRIPDVPEDPELRDRLMRRPHAELVAELEAADPELATRTDLASTKRVVRALELVAHQARSPLETSKPLGFGLRSRVFCVQVPRAELYRRIDDRLQERLDAGMVAEVRGLLDRGVPLERLHLLGMEYRHLADHVMGATSLEQAVATLRREIRHLAKRQGTYFRGLPRRGIPVTEIAPGDARTILAAVAAGRWDPCSAAQPAGEGDPQSDVIGFERRQGVRRAGACRGRPAPTSRRRRRSGSPRGALTRSVSDLSRSARPQLRRRPARQARPG